MEQSTALYQSPAFEYPYSTLSAIMRAHAVVFHNIPGKSSSYYPIDTGDEWRCTNAIGPLELVLSLRDSGKIHGPVVQLLLVKTGAEDLHLPVADLASTHDLINNVLKEHAVSIALFEEAANYLDTLEKMKEKLGRCVYWPEA